MKIAPSICAAVGLLGATLIVGIASQDGGKPIGQALAQPGKAPPTFDFYACNKSDSATIYLAVVTIAGNQLQAKGWTSLPKSKCEAAPDAVKVGVFGRPSLWWYASDGDGTWGSDKNPRVQICVNLNDNFEYSWDGKARECKAGEQPVLFNELKVEDNKRVVPLILN
jgi:hypothetical protein